MQALPKRAGGALRGIRLGGEGREDAQLVDRGSEGRAAADKHFGQQQEQHVGCHARV